MQMSEEAGQSGMRPGDKENKTGTQKEEGEIFRIEKGRPAAQGSGAAWVETDHKRSTYKKGRWNETTTAIFYMSFGEERPCGGSPETQRRHP